jgi:hypothetical protein
VSNKQVRLSKNDSCSFDEPWSMVHWNWLPSPVVKSCPHEFQDQAQGDPVQQTCNSTAILHHQCTFYALKLLTIDKMYFDGMAFSVLVGYLGWREKKQI